MKPNRSWLALIVSALVWLAPLVLRQMDTSAPVYNMPVGSTLLDVPGIWQMFLATLITGGGLAVGVTGWVEPHVPGWSQRRMSLAVAPIGYALTHTVPFVAQFGPLLLERPALRSLILWSLVKGLGTEFLFVSLAALGSGLGLVVLDWGRGFVRGKLALSFAARKA